MVLLAPPAPGQPAPQASLTLDAEVLVLSPDSSLGVGAEPLLQCLAVRQCARVIRVHVEGGLLLSGQRGRVTLQFKFAPEWVREGQRILLQQGALRGLGLVVQAHRDAPTHLPPLPVLSLSQSLGHSQGLPPPSALSS